jgi:hypothetical protein
MLRGWDGTIEPSSDTLRYTVEWKGVLNTERMGINTEENVFLTPGAFWNAALRGKVDVAFEEKVSLGLCEVWRYRRCAVTARMKWACSY